MERIPVRRKDRAEVSDAWIRELLQHAPVAVIGLAGTDFPHLNTNLFVFAESLHRIYFHTARTGRTRELCQGYPRASLQVWSMGRLLPAAQALDFSVEYASVALEGQIRVVAEEEEARLGLQMLLDKYFPHLKPDRDYRGITGEELARTSVYAFEIERWSGKRKAVEPEFEGAFLYSWPSPFEAAG